MHARLPGPLRAGVHAYRARMAAASIRARRVASVVELLASTPGRYSTELGIDLDAGGSAADRWFLAATLFGARISAQLATRTYRALAGAGIESIGDVRRVHRSRLIRMLDEGGYARYDERTATRLKHLAEVVVRQFPFGLDAWGQSVAEPDVLAQHLDALPGWGPITVSIFLRELRGRWPAARLEPSERVQVSAAGLGLVAHAEDFDLRAMLQLADDSDVDPRDLEAALFRHSCRYPADLARITRPKSPT